MLEGSRFNVVSASFTVGFSQYFRALLVLQEIVLLAWLVFGSVNFELVSSTLL